MVPGQIIIVNRQFDWITIRRPIAELITVGVVYQTVEGNFIIASPTITGASRITFITDKPTIRFIKSNIGESFDE